MHGATGHVLELGLPLQHALQRALDLVVAHGDLGARQGDALVVRQLDLRRDVHGDAVGQRLAGDILRLGHIEQLDDLKFVFGDCLVIAAPDEPVADLFGDLLAVVALHHGGRCAAGPETGDLRALDERLDRRVQFRADLLRRKFDVQFFPTGADRFNCALHPNPLSMVIAIRHGAGAKLGYPPPRVKNALPMDLIAAVPARG